MPKIVTFDGPNKLIIELDTGGDNELDFVEIYSEWKEWVRGIVVFDTEDDVSTASETVTITGHGISTGTPVVYDNLGGTENVGLTDGTEYYAREIDFNTFELYDTRANAEGSPSTTGRIDLTASGVGNGETHQLTTDNAKFLQAIDPIGGDPITLTRSLGITYFLENGWRIRPAESSHKLTIVGNVFTREPGQSAFVDTIGAFTVNAETQVSNLIDTVAGGSGLTPTESTRLLEIWQRLGLDPDEEVTYTDTGIVVGSITLTISEPDSDTTVVARQ